MRQTDENQNHLRNFGQRHDRLSALYRIVVIYYEKGIYIQNPNGK